MSAWRSGETEVVKSDLGPLVGRLLRNERGCGRRTSRSRAVAILAAHALARVELDTLDPRLLISLPRRVAAEATGLSLVHVDLEQARHLRPRSLFSLLVGVRMLVFLLPGLDSSSLMNPMSIGKGVPGDPGSLRGSPSRRPTRILEVRRALGLGRLGRRPPGTSGEGGESGDAAPRTIRDLFHHGNFVMAQSFTGWGGRPGRIGGRP